MFPRGSKPTISVVFCTLNEAGNLCHVLPKIPDWVDEVVLVDGGSTDNTVEIAKSLCPKVKVVYQQRRGKGDALWFGVKYASGNIIITLDADGATDPKYLPKFIEPLLAGYDFVKGSRFALGAPRNKPRHRIIGNWIITVTFNMLFWRRYTDICSGYNAFWRDKLGQMDFWSRDGFENEPLMNARIARKGLKVKEVGYVDEGRIRGKIKEQSWRQGIKAIKSILRARFRG